MGFISDLIQKCGELRKKNLNLNLTDVLFYVTVFVIFTIFLLIWNNVDLSWFGINRGFLNFWVPFITVLGLLITIRRQFILESKLQIYNRAIVQSNIRICHGLIDDINVIINSGQEDYRSINLLRERIEVHLQYCQNCCSDKKVKDFKKMARGLSKWEVELRAKTKSNQNNFDDAGFSEYLRTLKTFLIKEDHFNFKI